MEDAVKYLRETNPELYKKANELYEHMLQPKGAFCDICRKHQILLNLINVYELDLTELHSEDRNLLETFSTHNCTANSHEFISKTPTKSENTSCNI